MVEIKVGDLIRYENSTKSYRYCIVKIIKNDSVFGKFADSEEEAIELGKRTLQHHTGYGSRILGRLYRPLELVNHDVSNWKEEVEK